MKRKNNALLKFLVVICVVIVCVLFLPSEKEKVTPEQTKALTHYIEKINELNAKRARIVLNYQQLVLEETEVTMAYRELEETILPDFTDYQREVKALVPTDQGIKTVHEDYLIATQVQHQSFENYIQSYRTQEEALFNEANEQLEASSRHYQDFDQKLRQLADTYNVTLPK